MNTTGAKPTHRHRHTFYCRQHSPPKPNPKAVMELRVFCKMKTPLCKRLPNGLIEKIVVELDDFIGRYRTHTSRGERFINKKHPDYNSPKQYKAPIIVSEWVNVEATKKRTRSEQAKKVVKKMIKKMIKDGYVLNQNDIKPINPFTKK